MEISVLRYFLEIARKGSMTAAAEVLHVSQSALSKQMKELEDELGKKLFRRGSRSMSLTEEGILLRRRTEDIQIGKVFFHGFFSLIFVPCAAR